MTQIKRVLCVALVMAGAAFGYACVGDSPGTQNPVDAGTDTPTLPESGANDTGADAQDAGTTPDASTVYNDITQKANWSTFDLKSVSPALVGYIGCAFDGRYLYLAPSANSNGPHGLVARYDTTAPFAMSSSWSSFDTTTVAAAAKQFAGAVFDGNYVYFIPLTNTAPALITRYDTTGSFTGGGSWSTFDTTTVNANANSFAGAVYDNKQYLYLVPSANGVITRYDTKAAFKSAGSYTTFDTNTLTPQATWFEGAIYDGQYIYFIPSYTGGTVRTVVARYNTQATFSSGGSWSTFDLKGVNAGAGGFIGGGFDGRHVYFVPHYNGAVDGLALQYDPQGPGFTNLGSWVGFDMTTANAGLRGTVGSAYDGRYMYFGAYSYTTIGRVDSTTPFGSGASWSAFDPTGLDSNAQRFFGVGFDGKYVYFIPGGTLGTSIVLRFDAKTPKSMPPGYSGSFL